MALTTITVTGTYKDAQGNAQSGSVLFTPSWPLVSSANDEFLTQTAVVASLSSGSFSVTLACTDNATLLPTGWAYVVNVAVPGQQSVFNVYLPSTLGSSVDLSALAPDESTQTPAVPLTGTITPGTAAGGDLYGTYPSPGVQAVHGVVVSGTPSAGQAIVAQSATAASWSTVSGGGGNVASVFGRTGTVTAQTGDYTAAQVGALSSSGGTLSGGLTVEGALLTPPSVLTDGATIAVNAALSDFFRVTLGGNRTLANPTNPVDGQAIVFEIIQDGTGSRTLAYGGQYSFPTSIGTPVLSTSPGFHDFLAFRYDSGTTTWYCAGFVPQSSPSSPLAIGSGGTGQSTASAAFNALSPMTTLGDLIYGGASGAGTRLGGNTTTQVEYLQSTGTGSAATAPAWATVSGQYLCAPSQYAPGSQTLLAVGSTTMGTFGVSTTVASGSNGGEISQIASWASPSGGVLDVASTTGFTSTGSLIVAASGTTAAIVTYTGTAGGNSFTGCAYVSGSATGTVATGGIVAQSGASSLVSTNVFTAPASGSVVVTANLVGYVSAAATGVFGLAAHGTVTPIVTGEFVFNDSAATIGRILNPVFVVTSLTPGTSYQFDLLGAATNADFLFIAAQSVTSTTPTLSSKGAPATMLVQAV